MNKFNISIVEPVGGHGGLDFYNLGLTEALSKLGCEVYLYTSDTTKLDNEIKDIKTIVRKYYKNIYTNENKIIRGLRYVKGTFKSLIKSKMDKVQVAHFHIYNFSNLELLNMRLFKLLSIKIVATIHDVDKLSDFDEAHSSKMYQNFKKVIDNVIVHTDFTKNELQKKFTGISDSYISVVPHGDIDFMYNSNIKKLDALSILNLNKFYDRQIILLFGQIKKVKGLDVLLKAFAIIKDKYPNSMVLVAGKLWKNKEDEYIKIIQDNKMNNQVFLDLKFITNEEVPLYFKIADVVALPYKKIYNSGVILRAMDYGSTLIVSNLEPLTKIISHNENGYIFESENVEDMAQKLDELLTNNNLRNKLKYNAKDYIMKNFSLDIVANKTLAVYRKTLELK